VLSVKIWIFASSADPFVRTAGGGEPVTVVASATAEKSTSAIKAPSTGTSFKNLNLNNNSSLFNTGVIDLISPWFFTLNKSSTSHSGCLEILVCSWWRWGRVEFAGEHRGQKPVLYCVRRATRLFESPCHRRSACSSGRPTEDIHKRVVDFKDRVVSLNTGIDHVFMSSKSSSTRKGTDSTPQFPIRRYNSRCTPPLTNARVISSAR
jgi:hypothetical protein